MSAKNRLQEHFQRNQLPLPKYTSTRSGGTDHKPLWLSCVKISNDTEIKSDIMSNKIEAEQSAAEKALLALVPTENINPKTIAPVGTALLVDVENLPNFIDEIVKEIAGLKIYAFVGEHHCLAQKNFPDGVIKVISPSTRSDGTDTCMQVYVGYLLARNEYNTYLIATRDHYGSALVDMITANIKAYDCSNSPIDGFNIWKAKDARLVTQVSHILI